MNSYATYWASTLRPPRKKTTHPRTKGSFISAKRLNDSLNGEDVHVTQLAVSALTGPQEERSGHSCLCRYH